MNIEGQIVDATVTIKLTRDEYDALRQLVSEGASGYEMTGEGYTSAMVRAMDKIDAAKVQLTKRPK